MATFKVIRNPNSVKDVTLSLPEELIERLAAAREYISGILGATLTDAQVVEYLLNHCVMDSQPPQSKTVVVINGTTLTQEQYDVLKKMAVDNNNKIMAIKQTREWLNNDLKEAKDLVEHIVNIETSK